MFRKQHGSSLTLSWVTVGAFEENSYVVVDTDTGDAVFVDPGDNDSRILDIARTAGATPRAIWLTHGHVDHIGGIAMVKREYDIPTYLHPADRPVYDAQQFFADAYQFAFEVPPPPDRLLADGDVLVVGNLKFTVSHTPGHAPGHVVFRGDEIVLGGDLLFAGSIGRTDLPLASPAQMDNSLKIISAFAPELVVYPGHGPSTTIGQELRTNPFLNGSAYVKGYSA